MVSFHTKLPLASILIPALVFGCRSKPSAEEDAPAASAATIPAAPASNPVASAKPVPPVVLPSAMVAAQVNPKGLPPHSGPRGTVKGVVRALGPPPPPFAEKVESMPEGKCRLAHEMYGKLYREGPERGLADVLVAVTGYKGFVPAEAPAVSVNARGCAFDRRTIAVTFGQSIEVQNRDANTYMPRLLGQPSPALLVAMPGGDPVKLLPMKIGQYALQDASHPFATADVYVLRYATTDVTSVDGTFSIDRVPAGEVTVSAFLPITNQTVEKKVVVPDGGVVDVDFTIEVDPARREKARDDQGAPASAPSSSGASGSGG